MTKTLVIAEKPSVANDIVKAISQTHGPFKKNDEYFESDTHIVTSAVGHLLEIRIPEEFEVKQGKWNLKNLPVIPPRFDLNPIERTKPRLQVVVRLAKRKDVTELVNACDAGREGELIFRLIEQYAGGAQGTLGKPIKRLWLQSMTPQAIRDGFKNLRTEAQMKGLADAARSRSEADWIVGINGTRAMTAFNSKEGGFFLTTVGRVQTPTLSILVEREDKIRKHVSRDFWEVHGTFSTNGGQYTGKWFDPKFKKAEDTELKNDRVWEKPTAENIIKDVKAKSTLVIVKDETRPSSKASPLLFDLTSLQRECNGRFSLSAKNTLSIAQALYEKHKVLTYPRTDSRFLTEDYIKVAQTTMESLANGAPGYLSDHAKTAVNKGYIRFSKRIFDNSKVSDHFAIIPTGQIPYGLNDLEQRVYDVVARRFMAVFFPNAEFSITTRTTTVGENNFITHGKVLNVPGWLAIYGKGADDEDGDDKTQSIVALAPDSAVKIDDIASKDLQTKPPPRYSEATLLGAMECAGKSIESGEIRDALQEKGLGTPATRAATIEGLIGENYVVREGRDMSPTAKAFQLMTLLKGLDIRELSRADLTGEWEHKLSLIEKGQLTRDQFMAEIATMTTRMVNQAREYDRETIPGDYVTLKSPCPNCTKVVKETYRRYACDCGFNFAKAPAGRIFEYAEAEELVTHKRIGPLAGFRSKTGFPFKSEVALVFDEALKNYKLEFDFGEDAKKAAGPVDLTGKTVVGKCPKCSCEVYENGKNWVCGKAVETESIPVPTCDFKPSKTLLQHTITDEEIRTILAGQKTPLITDFISSRNQRAFKAMLLWDADKQRISFEFTPREPGKEGSGGGFKKFGNKGNYNGPKLGTAPPKDSTPKQSSANPSKPSMDAAVKKAFLADKRRGGGKQVW